PRSSSDRRTIPAKSENLESFVPKYVKNNSKQLVERRPVRVGAPGAACHCHGSAVGGPGFISQ
ncbi:MAG: hypothetical protein ACKPKO_50955, partial [Candidatus Fonsibacter sp.]